MTELHQLAIGRSFDKKILLLLYQLKKNCVYFDTLIHIGILYDFVRHQNQAFLIYDNTIFT
jgi:hypothetical protein